MIIPSLLAVGLDRQARADAIELDALIVNRVSDIAPLLEVLSFDLVIAGQQLDLDGMSQLSGELQLRFPSQRWAIVASSIDSSEERYLRSLGSSGVFDDLFSAICCCLPTRTVNPNPGRKIGRLEEK